ncbi:hypothetical protein ACFZCK_15310 [Kitasatospora purpeofusca]|uniref:hypothetical protein n=1 Tax=Kitasatospora purpeofusca TaxID=67352 RepID=UPI0036E598B6
MKTRPPETEPEESVSASEQFLFGGRLRYDYSFASLDSGSVVLHGAGRRRSGVGGRDNLLAAADVDHQHLRHSAGHEPVDRRRDVGIDPGQLPGEVGEGMGPLRDEHFQDRLLHR